MTYICLIETRTSTVPYLEVLPAATLEAARDEARRLMREHGAPIAAHIFRDDERLDTILMEDEPPAPGLLRHGPPRRRDPAGRPERAPAVGSEGDGARSSSERPRRER